MEQQTEYKIIERIFEGEKFNSVFEIGCGNGSFLEQLTNNNSSVIVGGNDIRNLDIQRAKAKFPKFSQNFTFHNISEPWVEQNKSYDIVFSVGVLIYISDPIPVIREMVRVGKKVILAEIHNAELDENTTKMEVWTDNGASYYNIIRNYNHVFKKMGINAKIKDVVGNKTIFEI